ncbi:MAG: hypothetical protein ACRDPM_06310, partial [Solirubrobacteraceae bacterium]
MTAHDQLERQLMASIARRGHRRWPRRARPGRWSRALAAMSIAVSGVAGLAVAVFAIVCLHHRPASSLPRTPSAPAHVQSPSACDSHVRLGVLPVWARSGFSASLPRMPHVLGSSGDIVAILFAHPLLSPPARDHNNKILWVSRVTAENAGADLRIAAQRMVREHPVGSPVARTVVGGPGPSIIDLPAPGCWRFTLRWAGHVDHLDLQYA